MCGCVGFNCKHIPSDDHIMYNLTGLGFDFKSMIFVIAAKTKIGSIKKVRYLLLTQENRN